MLRPRSQSACKHSRYMATIAIATLAIGLSGCDKTEKSPTPTTTSASTSTAVPYQESARLITHASGDGSGKFNTGEEAYQKICAYCHDYGVGPVIKGRQLPPQMIEALVRNGLRAMPSFTESFIDDASLKALGEYIQSSAAPAVQATAPSTGS